VVLGDAVRSCHAKYEEKLRRGLRKEHGPAFLGPRGERLSPRVFQRNLKEYLAEAGLDASLTPTSCGTALRPIFWGGGQICRAVQELLGHARLDEHGDLHPRDPGTSPRRRCVKAHPRA
jgi:integrase/recombinase XerC